ncbi:MAG: hypothetical protein GY893_02890 [bacterium]|nr:hypothetical protein [bacterium]
MKLREVHQVTVEFSERLEVTRVMPGIYGAIARQTDRKPQLIADSMSDLLTHCNWYHKVKYDNGHCAFGALSTNPFFSKSSNFASINDSILLIEGTAFKIDGKMVPDDSPRIAEKILERYLRDGDDFINSIGGHFNLLIFDKNRNRLQILNDKLGFSHMYWYLDDEVFLFGPELKAFLSWANLDKTVDFASVGTFLTRESPHGTETLFKNIKMLAPAHRLVWDGNDLSISPRWKHEVKPELNKSVSDFADEAFDLFRNSVSKRLPDSYSDSVIVPITGGLDSRLLLHQVKDRQKLDLVTYGQEDCIETVISRQLCSVMKLESKHRLIEVNPDWAGEYARKAVWLNDGQANCRNATLIGVSQQLAEGTVPLLSGIIGPYLSIGTGKFCTNSDLEYITDTELLRNKILKSSGVASKTAELKQYINPELATELTDGAKQQIWDTFTPWRDLPTFADQKMLHMHFDLGRRMQTTLYIHRLYCHILTPFADEDLFDLWLRIPMQKKFGNQVYIEMYKKHLKELAEVPWSRTGHDLFAGKLAIKSDQKKRLRYRKFSEFVRKASLGYVNPRIKTEYYDRAAWARRNSIFSEELANVLGNVNSTGCDWFNQKEVTRSLRELKRGKDWHFDTLIQIYTMIVWHEQFVQKSPSGKELI